MLGREKMNGSEMRALWGSRIVIWITIILVLFRRATVFFCPLSFRKSSVWNTM